ncbi:cbb3-type cytochrome oxidase assembly protein CcoS [Sulfuriferula sp.]|uniref:cbb3-type cytochrome oxidase assembly protein CcoS n=1 Tax=Sulfuriferula sp. TaxID=2025307 RepID=UPI002730F846|nr:cbb3-type cytochrome oxidase assembly protein CcoS [Sulfuriferula sp.]MDP2025969.1 cbb3-type cytochrome oxidase assembly protein CcoS [Sulfuriferula sp.]
MTILLLLIPISLLVVGLIAWVMLWAGKNGQFDDLEGPAYSVLMDDDTPLTTTDEPVQRGSHAYPVDTDNKA